MGPRITLAVLLISVGVASGQMKTPSVGEVEQSALQARMRIRTATVKLEIDSRRFPSPAPGDEKSQRTLWLDGARIRGDITRQKGADVGIRFVDCVNCEKAGWGIAGNGLPGAGSKMGPVGEKRADYRHAINPRLLGYYPMIVSGLWGARLDGVVGSANRGEPTIASERLNGTECWVLRWLTTQKVRTAVWVAPSKGWNVVRMEHVMPEGEKSDPPPVKGVLESDVVPAGSSGLWFPRRVVLRQSRGPTPILEETVDVTEARINEPIAPETFTLSGLQLREGTHISVPDRKQSGFLRGGKIVPPTSAADVVDTTPPVAVGEPAKTNYWLVAISVLCAVGAVALIVVRRIRRATA